MDPLSSLTAGLIAGLALAVPLGAIGVLLIQEGASRGWVRGAPAAAAVATVDLIYCVTAVLAGATLSPVITSWTPWPRIIGGTALLSLAAWNLIRARLSATNAKPDDRAHHSRSSRRYALFFGLTAINPATLVYFAAITTGIAAISSSVTTAVPFVFGVAMASLGWQLLLVLMGALVRWKTGARFRYLTSAIGNGVVGVLGILMITGLVL